MILRFGSSLPPVQPQDPSLRDKPDWVQANPRFIAKSLEHALSLPSGGWFVIGASRDLPASPTSHTINGQEIVVWRDKTRSPEQTLCAAPDACPHMGAKLSSGHTHNGQIVCPWHGLALSCNKPHGPWKPYKTFDDGVLGWVQLPGDTSPTDRPFLPARPTHFIDAVVHMEARCEPQDVIANRLDPWHGAHFHPYSFASLQVLHADESLLRLRVAKRVAGPVCVEVEATFSCPDPRTIVMAITQGEGQGSTVETHATPISPNRTAIIEATFASSSRPGFQIARALSPLIRPFIQRSAARLWQDDAPYAERLFELRNGK